jgi:mannose-1-phosphate guanylyltransferase/mannose-6-phosphate isomerase
VSLIGKQSLFALTIARISEFGLPICVANEGHRFFVQEELSNFFPNKNLAGTILLEPDGRNTAAAMASSALMPGVSSSDLLLFLPSDHYIPDVDSFISTIQSGVAAALAGNLVVFGIRPSFASTAYGYIHQGPSLTFSCESTITSYKVNRFVEKPPIGKAQDMFLSGDYLWNAGIFLCQASTLTAALSIHAPDILVACEAAMNNTQTDGCFVRPDKEAFLGCRSDSLDYAVMEHFDKVAVVTFNGVWSDVGSWNAVAALSNEDEFGNRIAGQGLVVNSMNTYINAKHRLVVALGTSNLVIVDTPDALLVTAVDKVEEVKEVVGQLKKNSTVQAVSHRQVTRPWGWYDSIDRGDFFQVKRITVKPGASLSLQMHQHRAEHWIVVRGIAKVTNGEKSFLLEENQSTYIPRGVKHRLENPGNINLEMIEVQSGNYLGEDDIVRFDDIYGRS